MPLKLLIGIRHFKNHHLKKKKEFLATLSKGQSPDVIFVTCSDSRIDPLWFTDSGLGRLFFSRNPGNIIPLMNPAAPSGENATIEYGLEQLNISEIIICGHSHCGAMEGLLTPELEKKLPITAAWLQPAQILVKNLEQRHPEQAHSKAALLKCLTQDNIVFQMERLKTHPLVEDRFKAGKLKIHGWYYEIETGEVYIYNEKTNDFVSFEDTVHELALEKLHVEVKKEALNYLRSLLKPNSDQAFRFLIDSVYEVRSIGVSPIWEHIESKVRVALKQQIGALYVTEEGNINPLFEELLKKGPKIRLDDFDAIDDSIRLSPFYRSASSLMSTSYNFYAVKDASFDKEQTQLKARL